MVGYLIECYYDWVVMISVSGWPIASLELEKWPLLILGKTTMHFYCWRIIARRSTEGAAYNVPCTTLPLSF